jgi:hypothetical protein
MPELDEKAARQDWGAAREHWGAAREHWGAAREPWGAARQGSEAFRGASRAAGGNIGEWIRLKKGGASRLHQTSLENKLARDCR